jgi:hypothetical protein
MAWGRIVVAVEWIERHAMHRRCRVNAYEETYGVEDEEDVPGARPFSVCAAEQMLARLS